MSPAPRQKKPAKPTPPPGARAMALDLIAAVLHKGQMLDAALSAAEREKDSRFMALEPRDRAFARLITATVLRRLGQIDAIIATYLKRPLGKKGARVHDILRLSIAQLVFLDTPPHAAVDTAVDLTRSLGHAPLAGLVNAVLRKLIRDGKTGGGKPEIEKSDAPRLNTPDWLWDSWTRAYGEETTRAMAAAHLADPPLDFTIRPDPAVDNSALWAEKLGGVVLATGSVRLTSGGQIREMAGYSEGAWWVQDAASALPVRLLGDVQGKRVADLCAAPGGKTAQLAASGARITAVERSKKRLERMEENLSRLGFNIETVCADAATWRPDTPFDAILLDAPCTATGSLRRHPDVARLKSADDVTRLAAEQDRLIANAAEMLSPGGTLVYCTCSLQKEEGEERIAHALKTIGSLERSPIRAEEIGGLTEAITEKGEMRTLPCHLADLGGLDGFFAARLIKK